MSDDRLITAIGRIERALSRIEGSSDALSGGKAGDSKLLDTKLLEVRHRQLRARTQSVIEQLDRLIGGNGTDGGNGAIGRS
jgi:hypothetical protein